MLAVRGIGTATLASCPSKYKSEWLEVQLLWAIVNELCWQFAAQSRFCTDIPGTWKISAATHGNVIMSRG